MKKTKIIIGLVIIVLLIALIVAGVIIINTNKSKEVNENNSLITNNDEIKSSNENIDNNKGKTSKNIAVVYFSATGNTKEIAEYIKEEANCDIYEIVPKQKYTSSDLNYGDNNTRATKEQRDKNARPEIKEKIDVSNYDTIFLGYPIWWGDVPKIILTFIDNTDLDEKTIIPFCTSGSSGISQSENTLKQYKGSVNWLPGKRFSNSSRKDEIKNWIDSLNIINNSQENEEEKVDAGGEMNSMNEFIIEVNNKELVVKVEDNSSSKALIEKLKQGNITINARDYSSFEKVGELGFSLPTNDTQITTKPGDVILYQGNNICLYYGTNSWNFTKLGEVTNVNQEELKNILGDGNVTMTLKSKE